MSIMFLLANITHKDRSVSWHWTAVDCYTFALFGLLSLKVSICSWYPSNLKGLSANLWPSATSDGGYAYLHNFEFDQIL